MQKILTIFLRAYVNETGQYDTFIELILAIFLFIIAIGFITSILEKDDHEPDNKS